MLLDLNQMIQEKLDLWHNPEQCRKQLSLFHISLKMEKEDFLKDYYISMASDAFFPFRDNIDVANKFNVKNIIQPGGSMADENIIEACNEYNMVMCFTGHRMFYH